MHRDSAAGPVAGRVPVAADRAGPGLRSGGGARDGHRDSAGRLHARLIPDIEADRVGPWRCRGDIGEAAQYGLKVRVGYRQADRIGAGSRHYTGTVGRAQHAIAVADAEEELTGISRSKAVIVADARNTDRAGCGDLLQRWQGQFRSLGRHGRLLPQPQLGYGSGIMRATERLKSIVRGRTLRSRPNDPLLAWSDLSGVVRPASDSGYRYFAGRIIARHICATGLLSKPSPCSGWRKFRPITSVNSSSSTFAFGSNE